MDNTLRWKRKREEDEGVEKEEGTENGRRISAHLKARLRAEQEEKKVREL